MYKKQTTVEYYEIEHRQLLIKLERKAISIGEYAVSSFELFKQALQMEREQIEEAVKICVLEDRKLLRQSSCFCVPFLPKPKIASEYYTQTYGKCTQQS